jgi:uncharacterized protein YbaP (TraB family)
MDGTFFSHLRKRASVAIAAAGALLVSACATVPVAEPAPRVEGPALWKVADADTTIYLFGTVHALPKDVPWMRGAIGPALESADTLVTEVDISNPDVNAMQKVVLEKGVLPAGQTLRGLLTPEQRATYETAIVKLGMPVDAFDRFEPWYASLMFALIPLAKAGIVGENGVEKTLAGGAGATKKRAALETIDYQLSLFDELPQGAQVDYLMKVIEGNGDIKAQLEKMMAEWLAGDADGLADLMNEDFEGDSALLERLLYQRNVTWAGWIADRLATPGTVFVAVGAGHLAGPKSMQAALAARGIQTTRVQ